MADVRPETLDQAASKTAASPPRKGPVATTPPEATLPPARRPSPGGTATEATPLSGRRVLVLGGTHLDVVTARTRVVELGGSAAVLMSRSVTDVLLLTGGKSDRRMRGVAVLRLPVRDEHWFVPPTAPTPADTSADRSRDGALPRPRAPDVLPRGGGVRLPAPPSGTPSPHWYLTATWGTEGSV
ncbi:hypothetical protein [Streptomyces sp. NPDC056244]|uniref:hypothetical protein n=1 Tax=Streptomyces sp. NPDC056244 TaxID=3345762 RepID=UPI0035E3ABF0